MLKHLIILAIAALSVTAFAGTTGVQALSDQEAVELRGNTKYSGKKCTHIFKSHDCNDRNSIQNCSGGGIFDGDEDYEGGGDGEDGDMAAECKTCFVAGEKVTDKVWSCRDKSGWDCNTNGDPKEPCGTKWTGTCYLDAGTNEWFCEPTADSTAKCINKITKICN